MSEPATRSQRQGQALRRALAAPDPLAAVRETIAEHNESQQVVVWAFACMLETNSAGLSIVLDRFDGDELAKVESALKAIGATRTLEGLRKIRSDGHAVAPPGAPLVAEMERRLLAFCRANVDALAAVPGQRRR